MCGESGVPGGVVFICFAAWAITSVGIAASCLKPLNVIVDHVEEIDFQQILQVNNDWKKTFVSDIEILDASSKKECNSLYEKYPLESYEIADLFSYDWYGIRGLQLYGRKFQDYDTSFLDKEKLAQMIKPFPQVQATIFGGKRICAIKYREGSFEKTLQPQSRGEESCPDNHFKCNSENQNLAYQLCIPVDPVLENLSEAQKNKEMQNRCPINKLEFVNKFTKVTNGYEERDFNENFKIVFSKSHSSLPVSEFNFSQDVPCMDFYAAQSYKSAKYDIYQDFELDQLYFFTPETRKKFWKKEQNKYNLMEAPKEFKGTCDTDNNSNKHFDKRFHLLSRNGPHFSHELMLKDNQIDKVKQEEIDRIGQKLDMNTEAQAKEVKYNYWARNTIEPFKCSLYDGSDKSKLVEEINKSAGFLQSSISDSTHKTLLYYQIGMYVLAFFQSIPLVPFLARRPSNGRKDTTLEWIGNNPKKFFVLLATPIFLTTTVGCLLMLYRLHGISAYTSQGTEIVNTDFVNINPCFDVYIRVNPQEYIDQFKTMSDAVSKVWTKILIVLFVQFIPLIGTYVGLKY